MYLHLHQLVRMSVYVLAAVFAVADLGSFQPGAYVVPDPAEIHFMQSFIKNTTGEFTVLGNSRALRSGELSPEMLRFRVWQDTDGKIWTLDHRRLAVFRLSGLEEAPIQWANPSREMWKISTENGGESIWLKFDDGRRNMLVK